MAAKNHKFYIVCHEKKVSAYQSNQFESKAFKRKCHRENVCNDNALKIRYDSSYFIHVCSMAGPTKSFHTVF